MAIDLIYDENKELLIKDGDLVLGESDYQHVELLLSTEPGEWKESPLTGVGINKHINGKLDGDLKRLIALQLEADGFQASGIEIKEQQINIDGKYS